MKIYFNDDLPDTPAYNLASKNADAHYDLLFGLVKLRQSRGLTQKEVAKRLGISQQSVSEFEQMDANPSLSTITAYALAIGAELEFKVGQFSDYTDLVAELWPSGEKSGTNGNLQTN